MEMNEKLKNGKAVVEDGVTGEMKRRSMMDQAGKFCIMALKRMQGPRIGRLL